jgi:CHASE1-domain containing sensor protein
MISLMSLEETVLRTRRVILEAPLKRRIRIIVLILMVVVLLSLVLLELVLEVDLLNSRLSLSRDWD